MPLPSVCWADTAGDEDRARAALVNGLHHVVSGDARNPTVTYLHGFMGSAADWREVTEALEDRFFCVAMDLPGHGKSLGLVDEDYSFEGAGRAVIHLLDLLEVEHATFAGYSMGGRLALYLALRHPERCDGLFLESASPGMESADEEKAIRLEREDFEEFVRDWYRQPLFESLAGKEELLKRIMKRRLSNEPAELVRSLRGMGTGSQPSLWGELDVLRVPALVVAGELDEKFVRIARRMAASSPNVHYAVVPGAGHNVGVEVPEAYLDLLESYLTSGAE